MSKHKKKFGPPIGPAAALPLRLEEVDALRWHMLNEKLERIKVQINALGTQQNQAQAELQAHMQKVVPKYQLDATTNVNLETGEIQRKAIAPAPKALAKAAAPAMHPPALKAVPNGKPAPTPAS